MAPRHVPPRRAFGAALLAFAALATTVGVGSTTEAIGGATRLTICHWVGAGRWQPVTPAVSSLVNGHGHHPNDIIPAFVASQGQRELSYGGLNLGPLLTNGITGQQILANGCRAPIIASTNTPVASSTSTVAPTPDPTVAPDTRPDGSTPPTPTTATPDTIATTTAVPDTVASTTTAAPPTPTTATPDTIATTTAVPDTVASTTTVVPDTLPNGVPTTAPFLVPPLTSCGDGEFEHEGSCFPIPPLTLQQTPTLQVSTSAGDPTPVPIVECTTASGGEIVTWFGYELDADEPVRVDRGDRNRIESGGEPPTLFGTGLHARVVAAIGTDGVASWTLGDLTVSSGPDTPDCDDPSVTTNTPPDSTAPSSTSPDTTAPDTSAPGTTSPGGTACDPDDAGCAPIRAVQLVLVDNYLECDGHAVARFAAFNTNGFALGGAGFSSTMAPSRLSEFAPQVIGDQPVAADDGTDLAEFVDVRYVTAVTWTVQHDGLESFVSAGISGARTNPACPTAHVETTGLDGLERAPIDLATTGGDQRNTTLLAALFVGLGVVLIWSARGRRREQIGV